MLFHRLQLERLIITRSRHEPHDTAEMYRNGRAEELIAEAVDGKREQVFLVSNENEEERLQNRQASATEA